MAPNGAVPPNQAKAMFFFGPGEYELPKIARALGSVMEGPIPWKTRAKMKRT
jgi:hypothetical protein